MHVLVVGGGGSERRKEGGRSQVQYYIWRAGVVVWVVGVEVGCVLCGYLFMSNACARFDIEKKG